MSEATSRREDLFGVHSSRGLRGHHNLGREVWQQEQLRTRILIHKQKIRRVKGVRVMVGCF